MYLDQNAHIEFCFNIAIAKLLYIKFKTGNLETLLGNMFIEIHVSFHSYQHLNDL